LHKQKRGHSKCSLCEITARYGSGERLSAAKKTTAKNSQQLKNQNALI